MQASPLSSKNGKMKFLLEEATPSQANAIRRTILSEVPTLAVESLIAHVNTSPLFDEVIAHRIGLVPVKASAEDLEQFNFRDACDCRGRGCANCTLMFSLEAEVPGMVYSHNFRSEDQKITFVEGIPILKLGKGQRVKLEAEAVLGRGRDHAKWQPAVVGYKYYPVIEVDESCSACGDCVEACPRKLLHIEDGKVKVGDVKECTICKACVDACEEEAITAEGDPTRFIFNLESQGSLEPEDIFIKACDIVDEKALRLSELLEP